MFKVGDEAWMLESGRYPRPVKIQKINGDRCVIRFTDRDTVSGTLIRMNRLYATKEEAQANALPKPQDTSRGYRDAHNTGRHYYED